MSNIETISRESLELQKAWLAGFIEGEGCFYIGFCIRDDRDKTRRTLRAEIFIGNTVVTPMIKVSQILCNLGVGFVSNFTRSKNKKWSDSLAIRVSGQTRCKKLCEILMPYFYGKREQAKQMLYAIDYRKRLAEKYGGNNKQSRLCDNQILQMMSARMKELKTFREDMSKLSRKHGEPVYFKKPSQTAILAALSYEDCVKKLEADGTVGSAWRHAEVGRDDRPAA